MARKRSPQTRLALNWHLDVIAVKLTGVREGRIRRLHQYPVSI